MSRDVLIVGGGVIGLSIARALKKAGAGAITLIEKGLCGEESSWAAAGMLGPQAEADRADEFLELCLRSRELFPGFASELLAETGIDIELDQAGTLYLSFSDADSLILDERLKWQSAAGLAVERLSATEVRRAEPFVATDVREALRFKGDWQVENRRLLAALSRYAEMNGIEVIENAAAETVILDGRRAAGVRLASRELEARQTILATGAWTSLVKLGSSAMPVDIEPVRGQILAFRTAKRFFEHVIVTPRGYIVPRADGRILAGSTTERVGFEKGTTEAAGERLHNVAIEIAPSLAGQTAIDSWSGLRPFAADGLPVLGPVAGIDGLTIASAHYRNGILLAPITAKLVADRIVSGIDAPAFTTFGADRFALKAGRAN